MTPELDKAKKHCRYVGAAFTAFNRGGTIYFKVEWTQQEEPDLAIADLEASESAHWLLYDVLTGEKLLTSAEYWADETGN